METYPIYIENSTLMHVKKFTECEKFHPNTNRKFYLSVKNFTSIQIENLIKIWKIPPKLIMLFLITNYRQKVKKNKKINQYWYCQKIQSHLFSSQ